MEILCLIIALAILAHLWTFVRYCLTGKRQKGKVKKFKLFDLTKLGNGKNDK